MVKPTTSPTDKYAKYSNLFDKHELDYFASRPDLMAEEIAARKALTDEEIAARAQTHYAQYAHLFDKYEFEFLSTRPDLMEEEIETRKDSFAANQPKSTTENQPKNPSTFIPTTTLFPDPYELKYYTNNNPSQLAKEIAIRKFTDDPYQRDYYSRYPSGVPDALPPELKIEKGAGPKQIDAKRREWEREKNRYNAHYQIYGDRFKWPGTRR